MKNRTTEILYSYWNDVRRGRLAPRRFEIEPARIASILAETMILERVDRTTMRFRLAGTRITEQFGVELRGRNFLDMWSNEDLKTILGFAGSLEHGGGALLLAFEATASSGRHVAFEAILLPLIHTNDTVDRFLGSVSCNGAPTWLGTELLGDLVLTRAEIVWPDGRPHAIAETMTDTPPTDTPLLTKAATEGRVVRFDRRQFRVLDGGRTH